jgi:hypothetical protein
MLNHTNAISQSNNNSYFSGMLLSSQFTTEDDFKFKIFELMAEACGQKYSKYCGGAKLKDYLESTCGREKTPEKQDRCFNVYANLFVKDNLDYSEKILYQKAYEKSISTTTSISVNNWTNENASNSLPNNSSVVTEPKNDLIDSNKKMVDETPPPISGEKELINEVKIDTKIVDSNESSLSIIGNSKINEKDFQSKIYDWIENRWIAVLVFILVLFFGFIKISGSYVKLDKGIFFVDGTDSILTCTSALIAIALSIIFSYLFNDEIDISTLIENYLYSISTITLLIIIRTISQNKNNQGLMTLYMVTKLILILMISIFSIVFLLLLLAAIAARVPEKRKGESEVEFYRRQKISDELLGGGSAAEVYKAASPSAFLMVVGAVFSINQLTLLENCYSLSLASITRWFMESFMSKEAIFQNRQIISSI